MTATVRSGRLPHVPALDGVRGVAVAAVLLHHAGHLEGGWLGVDLFFVLSGYLITTLLLQERVRSGRVSLRGFWARRVRRLGPALLVTLLAAAAYAALVARPSELLDIRRDGLATLFEVANWRQILVGGDYWAALLRPSPLRHTWSLSIEEQLYLVWPLLLVAVARARRRGASTGATGPELEGRAIRRVLVTAVGLALASAAAMVVLEAAGASRARLYYGTDTRAAAVMVGASLAALRLHLGPQRWAATRPARQVGAVGAAALLAVAWFGLDGASSLPYRGVLPAAGLGGAILLAGVVDRRHPGPLGAALSVAPLVWLGRISYGAYLYHWPLYLVIDATRTGLDGWALTAARVGATLVAAAASYRFLEEPIRSGRVLTGRQGRAAVPAGAALAVMALFATTLSATPGGGELAATSDRSAGPVRSSVPGAPVVMLAGDSVPLLLGVELVEQRDELGVSVLERSAPGCHLLASLGPVRGTEGDVRDDVGDCAADGAYRAEVERHRPDVVLLLFGEYPNQAVEIDGRWTMPCESTYLDAMRARLDAVVADLRATGAPVVVATAPGTSVSWVLERVPPGMDERVRCSNELLEDLVAATPGTSLVDLAGFVCPPGEPCKERIDGVDLREDGLHFQGEGAAIVNRWLAPQLVEAAQTG